MKAVVRYGMGSGEVGIQEIPVPEIGPGDVLMQVKAAGLCGSDIHIHQGRNQKAPIGSVIGHEFAGVVAKVGERVTAFQVGDRVVSDNTASVCGTCYACIRGEYAQCKTRKGMGYGVNGGFAEYVRIPEEAIRVYPSLLKVPEGISFDEAAILDPGANGYHAVLQDGKLLAGENVGVAGVGPLGLGSIAAAKAGGATNILAIVRSSTSALHREKAKLFGATHILEQDREDVRGIVDELTGGEGLEVISDNAGANELFPLLVDIVSYGGRIIRVGYDWAPLQHSINVLCHRSISLIGQFGYNPVSWRNMIRLIQAGKFELKGMITHTLPLTEYQRGVDLMLQRQAVKVIFHP